MPNCCVQGCEHEATRIWIWTSLTRGRLERMACMDHSQALEAGADWLEEELGGDIIMGADLPPKVTTATMVHNTMGSPSTHKVVGLTLEDSDGGEIYVRLRLDKDAASFLGRGWEGDDPDGDALLTENHVV